MRTEGEIVIRRPMTEIFDFVADQRNEPRYNPRMLRAEKVSSGPIGVGTRFRAATASIRRPTEMTIEVTTYDRPRRLGSWTRLSGMDIRGGLTFEPVPEGTLMRWSWDLDPQGVLKLLRPLIARMGRSQEQAIWASLKRYLEGSAS
jgi:hypothetical protein